MFKKYIKYINLINQYGGTYKWVYKESGTINKKCYPSMPKNI